MTDPMPDLYKLMDAAGLNSTNMLDSKRSMSKIVSEVRTKLAGDLKSYIARREAQSYNDGIHTKEVSDD